MVLVLIKDGKVRIGVDYTAANKGYNEKDFSYQLQKTCAKMHGAWHFTTLDAASGSGRYLCQPVVLVLPHLLHRLGYSDSRVCHSRLHQDPKSFIVLSRICCMTCIGNRLLY